MKVYTIIPGKLYQRGSISNVPNLEAALVEHGIKCVINVRTKEDYFLIPGVVYAHKPLPDGKKIPRNINRIAGAIAWQIEHNNPTLVYCNAGRNRSSLVNALVLMELGMSGKEAIEHIKKIRSGAFGSNPYFEEYLLSL